MAIYHKAGASFAIVKLTEGVDYLNPKASKQVDSSRANHLFTPNRKQPTLSKWPKRKISAGSGCSGWTGSPGLGT